MKSEFENSIKRSSSYEKLVYQHGERLFIFDDGKYKIAAVQLAWEIFKEKQTKVDELKKQLIEQGQRFNVQTQQIASLKWQLKRLGYTDNGGELMKPPIGESPKFDLLDELQKRVDAAQKLIGDWNCGGVHIFDLLDELEQALKGGIK